ncbi:MAG: glycerophosphodiester phosphodiesterase [Ignavibacteriae bacterium]|nr:glycerophosphodiester phosphodiesterase [Ignavibacteriota bacterium]
MKIVQRILIPITFILILSCSSESKEDMQKENLQKTNNSITIVAHRGASGYAPENTLTSMKKAIEMNAEMSELDVQETADGEIILLHDGTLKRTTGVDGNIWETNYSDLKGMDVGSWFSDEYKNEPIPTLKEVIDLVKGKMKLNIELKANKHEKMLAERSLKIVTDNNFLDQVVFTSFKFAESDKIRELNPKAKVGYIFSKFPKDVDVFTADIDLLSTYYKIVDAEFIKKAKANGKEVAVWTVNKPEDMKRMIEIGVDQIITNYPDVLRKILDSEK